MHRKIQLFTCSCYSCIASAACDATDDEKSRLLHAPPGRSVWAFTVHTGVSAVEPARRTGRQCPRAAARGLAIYTCHTQQEANDHHLNRFRSLYVVERDRERIRLVATRERETFIARSAREDTFASVVCALALWPLALAHVEYVGQASEHTHASRAHTCERNLCVAQDVSVCVGAGDASASRPLHVATKLMARGELGGLEMNFHQASVSFFCHLLLRSATLAFLLR